MKKTTVSCAKCYYLFTYNNKYAKVNKCPNCGNTNGLTRVQYWLNGQIALSASVDHASMENADNPKPDVTITKEQIAAKVDYNKVFWKAVCQHIEDRATGKTPSYPAFNRED